ncbi:MAG: putative toxin-antitoxin system toxin component, PIN family [Chloroherpetonaceae bacterium]|nr:putative toxin-antitoxin system toxin component, PIN family [Chloroherpetonaceae bacterium]MDW8466840.1 putative toxin-antitoxin system toxin component, PIN family [Chloroherpetonaceae bacterium]
MKSDRPVVLDANVIVSALLSPKGKARAAFDKAVSDSIVVVSPNIIAELEDVLSREKFNAFVSQEERLSFLQRFLEVSLLVSPAERIFACRDARDDKYLELAVAARADAIITGDQDLLALHPFRNIAILSPEQFLKMPA